MRQKIQIKIKTSAAIWRIHDGINGINHRRLVRLAGKVPVYRAGGSGSIPGRTNTQGLKIIEEKVLPLL